MSERRAKDLADIEPPRSILRIASFMRDLTRSGMPRLGTFAVPGGAMAVVGRPVFLPGAAFMESFARLIEHYTIQAEDLEAFASWLVLWTDKYREMEVIEDPKVYDKPAFSPTPRPLPVAAPPLSEETARRTRRRDDPPREPAERPRPAAEEPAQEPFKAQEPKRATFRPAKREVPEPVEPPKRIDLPALTRRAQVGTFGGGMMLAGAAIAPSPLAPGVEPQSFIPGTTLPSGPRVTIRAVQIDPSGAPIPQTNAPTFHPATTTTPSVAGSPRNVLSPQGVPAPEGDRAPFPANSPQGTSSPSTGTPGGVRTPFDAHQSPERPFLDSPTAPQASAETAKSNVMDTFARRPTRGFPSVRTILTGAAVLVPAFASAFSLPGKRPHRTAAEEMVYPEGGETTGAGGYPAYGEGQQTGGTARTWGGRTASSVPAEGGSTSVGSPSYSPDSSPAYPSGSPPAPSGGPIRAGGAFRSRGLITLGAAALAGGAMAVPGGGQWVPVRPEGQGFGAQEFPTHGFAPGTHHGAPTDAFAPRGGPWAPAQPGEEGFAPQGRGVRVFGTAEDATDQAGPGTRIPSDPRYGQITLIAPPLAVASAEGERAGSAVQFEWSQLAQNSGELDAGSVGRLAAVLPRGAQAIYPALPPGTAGATNLRLAPGLLGNLLEQGYGPRAAAQANRIATGTPSPAKVGRPVGASLVPVGRPTAAAAEGGVLGPGAIDDAGGAQAKRGGALDFLGLPVRLAPALGGRAELKQQQAAQGGAADLAAGRPVRPEAFAPLRQKLFPGLQSVAVEPDQAKWRKAAPSFGMRAADPTTVLSADATAKPPSAAEPKAPMTKGSFASRIAEKVAAPAGSLAAPLPSLAPPSPFRPTPPQASPTVPYGGPSLPSSHSPARGAALGATPAIPGVTPAPTGAPTARPFRPASSGAPVGFASRGPAIGSPGSLVSRGPLAAPSGPSAIRPTPEPTGVGRTSATAAPSAEKGGHVPFVERPASPPSPPPLKTALPGSRSRGPVGMPNDHGASGVPATPSATPTRTFAPPARPGGLGEALSSAAMPLAARATPTPATRPPITVSQPSLSKREGSTPEMLYAAARPRPAARPMTIQKAIAIDEPATSVTPDRGPRGGGGEQNDGREANEVNSLATEVWSLLKRRLANEAERRGRF